MQHTCSRCFNQSPRASLWKSTFFQINGSFRDPIGCFGLPHPGNEVTWGGFDGTVELIDRGFSTMVQHYIEEVILGKVRWSRYLCVCRSDVLLIEASPPNDRHYERRAETVNKTRS